MSTSPTRRELEALVGELTGNQGSFETGVEALADEVLDLRLRLSSIALNTEFLYDGKISMEEFWNYMLETFKE